MCEININKDELVERFNEFIQTYKVHYLMSGETSELKQNHPLFCLNDIDKLQQEIVNYIDGTKNNNCKINLCNKKIK
jgi:hypothetical protein